MKILTGIHEEGENVVYITGDTHGDQLMWDKCITPFLKSGDKIIVTGDFGVGFFDGRQWPEEMFYDYLADKDYTVLFCDGNHENFDKLYSYEIKSFCGGKAHLIRDNVIHLMRGEVYEIDGKKIFVMGGGYSLDKYLRKEGFSWWPQEMPDRSEYDNALDNLKACGSQVDHVITHTAPLKTLEYLYHTGKISSKNTVEDRELTSFLQYVAEDVRYKNWYFGHIHIDEELWKDQYAVYELIRELDTGKVIKNRRA